MKRKFLIASITALVLLSGCGKAEEPEVTTASTLPVKVVQETLKTEATTVSSVDGEIIQEEDSIELKETNRFLETIENNVDDTIDFSLVNVNDTWTSINCNLQDFLNATKISRCSWVTISNGDDEEKFIGNGYGVMSDPNDPTSFYGTLLGIECYNPEDAKIVKSFDNNLVGKYYLKAITSSAEKTGYDFEVLYFNGIKVGMTKEQVEYAMTHDPTEETTTAETEIAPEETSISSEISEAETSAEITSTEEETSEITESETSKSKEKSKKKNDANNEENPAETSVPEEDVPEETTTTVVATTTAPETDAPETMTESAEPEEKPIEKETLYYKNSNNTLVLFLKDGIVDKIYLFNNNTRKS